jgi:acyl carrier protein
MNEVREQIRSVLKEHGRFAGDPGEIGDDVDLYQLGMTSHASVGVMLALESTFDIEFPDRMLTRSVFESVAAISTAIEELLRGKAS